MADNVVITPGTGNTIAADELTDATLGSVKVQYVKLMDGTLDGSTKAAVGANGLSTDVKASVLPTGASTSTKQSDGSQKTQVVDGAGNVIGATSNALDINIKSGNPTSINVGTVTTLPAITGSVTANAGTNLNTSSLALETGGNLAAIKTDADTVAGAVSASKMNVNISSGSIANTTFAATQGTAANLNATVVGTGTFAVQSTDSVIGATFVVKTVDFSASATAQAIWTPAGGKKFVICDWVVSTSAAGVITIFDGTDNTTLRVAKLNFAANGGAVKTYKKPYVSATADNILKYTTGSVIAGSITVSGYEI
jgi:hypothetical protein